MEVSFALGRNKEILRYIPKSATDTIIGLRRPNTFATCPNSGCGTRAANTNEFAIHTYSVSPPISFVMVGNAVVMMEESRAARKDRQQSATNTPQKRRVLGTVFGAGEVSEERSISASAATPAGCEERGDMVDFLGEGE
jgi:hypothetical protein